MPATLAASALIHAAIASGIAGFAPRNGRHDAAPVPAVAIIELASIEVTLVPRAAAPPSVAAVSIAPGAVDHRRPGAAPEEPAPRAAPAPAPARSGLPSAPRSLSMRRPGTVEIRLPDAVAARAATEDGVPPPPVPTPSGRLAPAGRGAVIHDLVTTATVDPGGIVTFHDKPDFDIHLTLPLPSLAALRDPDKMVRDFGRGIGDAIDHWAEDPYAQTHAPPVAELPAHEQAVPGGWDSGSGGYSSAAASTASTGTVPLLGGSFDLAAWAERLAGNDPYRARKQAMLDATFEERAARGAVHHAGQRARSAELMRRNLHRLWQQAEVPAVRRARLFDLWDECEEGTGPAGEAGQRARDQVIGWIRARLPAGGGDAYTAEEITRLDAGRRSRQAFNPY